jgi:hypothetical protein
VATIPFNFNFTFLPPDGSHAQTITITTQIDPTQPMPAALPGPGDFVSIGPGPAVQVFRTFTYALDNEFPEKSPLTRIDLNVPGNRNAAQLGEVDW